MMDAKQITQALHGKWYRRYGSAPCPVCQAQGRKGQNALTLADGDGGRLLAHCKKSGCTFRDILAAAGLAPGDYAAPDPLDSHARQAQDRAEAEKRAKQAHRLWQDARPIGGTLAETYLRGRGISCPLPETLRFLPECWHPTAKRFPAMLARVDGGEGFAVHRTYLATDGRGKAVVKPDKLMLGRVSGGAVRLTEAHGPLVVAEGIETALSLACGLLGKPVTLWAALSTSGMRGLHLPPKPHRLTIAPDGDAPGKAAAHALAERAHALGWQVSLLPAPDGRDWNDILTMKGEIA
ncbi:toprim domain-containing protein [uncultured Roseovarius sp.]|uniref:toprim domain-containing protein n=1 Tax=uncultured Roseovarius sp. TaxID=293344 RepID=UPI0025977407|nr:toprim domain-containing protein [uncultured Roseovarius sp.]